MPPGELQVTHPQSGTGESANLRGHRLRETETSRDEMLHADPKPKEEKEASHRSEEECKVARLMKTSTKHLPPDSVRRIIRVDGEGD
jgi:hypothetical protein